MGGGGKNNEKSIKSMYNIVTWAVLVVVEAKTVVLRCSQGFVCALQF